MVFLVRIDYKTFFLFYLKELLCCTFYKLTDNIYLICKTFLYQDFHYNICKLYSQLNFFLRAVVGRPPDKFR